MADYDFLAHPAQVDVLGDYSRALQVNQGINQNRLFQAQQQGGQAFLDSLNPDGSTDQNKLLMGLKANPATALAALQVAQGGQTLSADERDQMMKKGAYGAALASQILVDHNGTAPLDALKGMYDRSVKDGHMTQAQEDQFMSGFGPDAMANASVVRQRLMGNIANQEALARANGIQSTATGPGGVLIGTNQSTQNGALSSPQQPGVQQGPSADWLSSTSDITNPDGSVTHDSNAGHIAAGRITPLGAVAPGYTAAPPGASARPPAGVTGGPGPQGNPNTFDGIPRPQPGNPLFGPLPGQPGAAPAPQGQAGPVSAPPAGPRAGGTTVAPNLLKVQGASADQYVADSRAAGSYQDRVLPLQQAAKALETAKTGEGSETLQSIASRIQTLTPDALKSIVPNFRTPDEIAAYDEARKYLTMAQQNRPGADRSDAGLATAGESSPSTHISPAAAKLLVQAQLGVERSKQAQYLEFNATHPQGTEGEYSRWLGDRAHTIDPRAFITDLQTPAQRKSYYDRLGDKEQENYLASYALAKKHSLLTMPNGQ